MSVDFELYSTTYDTINDPSTKLRVLKLLKKEASLKELLNAKVYYDHDSLSDAYRVQEVRFIKLTDSSNKSIKMMYDDYWHFKGTNLFCSSVICPYYEYPTQKIKDFITSLKLVE